MASAQVSTLPLSPPPPPSPPPVSRTGVGGGILVFACAAALVAARGAGRDWAMLAAAGAHLFILAIAATAYCRCVPSTPPPVHAVAMASVAVAALIGGASDALWTTVPWDSQVRAPHRAGVSGRARVARTPRAAHSSWPWWRLHTTLPLSTW